MKSKTKKTLLIVLILILAGSLLFFASAAAMDFDFSRLNTFVFDQSATKVAGSFRDLSLFAPDADIIIRLSDDDICCVECSDHPRVFHPVAVEDNTLCVNTIDCRRWVDYVGVNLLQPVITIYLPADECGCVTAQCNRLLMTEDIHCGQIVYEGDIEIIKTTEVEF